MWLLSKMKVFTWVCVLGRWFFSGIGIDFVIERGWRVRVIDFVGINGGWFFCG